MSPSLPDYSRVFNRLCHLVALSRDGKTAEVADHIIQTALVIDPQPRANPAEVSEAVDAYFGLGLAPAMVQSSLDRLASCGLVLRDRQSGVYRPSPALIESVQARIAEADELETRVKTEWLTQIGPIVGIADPSRREQLWQCLRAYMGRAFRRHGVETIRLLGSVPPDGSELGSLSSFLAEAARETCPGIETQVVKEAIRLFFLSPTPHRARYVSQLLDGTFAFFALAADEYVAAYLRGHLSSLTIFLDTNFIFGILGIHADPYVEVSKELVEIVQTHKLPFKLYYHEETLEEIRRTVGSIGERLKRQRWQQAVSRAAVRSGQLSGIELRYHQLNSETPLDPAIFLSRFEDPRALLEEQGFVVFRDTTALQPDEVRQRGELVAEYKEYLARRRPHRPKAYPVMNHDILVWRAANRQRSSGKSVLHVGALFLTVDFYFHCFDWDFLRGSEQIGITVLPNQFLQLLRPFIPTFGDFDQRFVETFAIPEFRAVGSDFSTTCSNVLAFLNVYSDMREETAARILANRMLIDSLRGVPETSPAFGQSIENAIVQENRQLLEEREATLADMAAAQQQAASAERQRLEVAQKLQTELAERRAKEENERREGERVAAELQAKASEIQRLSETAQADRRKLQNLELEKLKLHRQGFYLRSALALLLVTLGAGAIFFLPSQFNWSWLLGHPHRLGLQLCCTAILTAVGWVLVVPRHWVAGVSALLVGALLVMLQII